MRDWIEGHSKAVDDKSCSIASVMLGLSITLKQSALSPMASLSGVLSTESPAARSIPAATAAEQIGSLEPENAMSCR